MKTISILMMLLICLSIAGAIEVDFGQIEKELGQTEQIDDEIADDKIKKLSFFESLFLIFKRPLSVVGCKIIAYGKQSACKSTYSTSSGLSLSNPDYTYVWSFYKATNSVCSSGIVKLNSGEDKGGISIRKQCPSGYYCFYKYSVYDCRTTPTCTAGWKCKDSNNKAYQKSDCSWTSVTYCQYGCSNGVCKSAPTTCTPETWSDPYCTSDTTRVYYRKCLSDGTWSSIDHVYKYCESNEKCENGQCVPAYPTCASQGLEDGWNPWYCSTLRYGWKIRKYCDPSTGLVKSFDEYCGDNYKCEDGQCISLIPKSCLEIGLDSCSYLGQAKDKKCENNKVVAKMCFDAGYGLKCYTSGYHVLDDCTVKNEKCVSGECVKQQCSDLGYESCGIFDNWKDLKCEDNKVVGKTCKDIQGLSCWSPLFHVKEDCTVKNEKCVSGECIPLGAKSCEEIGKESCSFALINQWKDLECSSDNTRIVGKRCFKAQEDPALYCFTTGELEHTKEECKPGEVCEMVDDKPKCVSMTQSCEDMNTEPCKNPFATKDLKCDDNILVGKKCDYSTTASKLCWTILDHVVERCEDKEKVCDPESKTCVEQGKDCRTLECPEGEECKNVGFLFGIFDKWECKPIPTKCSICGKGVANLCDIKECHSLGCFISDEDKGTTPYVNVDNCVEIIKKGKECDSVNMTLSCETGYCKKEYKEKIGIGKKTIYICSDKPAGFCQYMIWAEKIPFVSGDNACSVGVIILILLLSILGVGGYYGYKYYQKRK